MNDRFGKTVIDRWIVQILALVFLQARNTRFRDSYCARKNKTLYYAKIRYNSILSLETEKSFADCEKINDILKNSDR